jgi:gliding motility-associated lipoprotein GldH
MQKKSFFPGLLILLVFCGCSKNDDVEVYYKFKDHTWSRFDPVRFELTVNAPERNYDVFLFIHHTAAYEFDNLDFNMIMTTPSGEERIKEYHMDIRRKDGGFIGKLNNDSCEISIALKKDLRLTKGILTLELENLVPRLQIQGLLGIGIRLRPVR